MCRNRSIAERRIVPGIVFQRGQVCGGRPCLGGSDALVDRYGFPEVGEGGRLVTRARRAPGGTFERPGLIQGTADLAGELEGLPVQGQRFPRPHGLGDEGACAVESLGFPLHITDFPVQRKCPLQQADGGRVVPGHVADAAQVLEGVGLAEAVAEVLIEGQGPLQEAGGRVPGVPGLIGRNLPSAN